MRTTVRTIRDSAEELFPVLKLAQLNSGTLGFLPKGAFSNYAARGQLLGAFERKNDLMGYLLYGINHKDRFAYLVHLCVNQRWRRKGVASLLFKAFKESTRRELRGVRVRCRRDYEVGKVWPKLGFAPVTETPGRSKQGSTLTVWWFDYGHPDLFRQNPLQESDKKALVVIDANIFYELQEPPSQKNKTSKALLSDWLQENVELCLTQEILTEIDRHPDAEVRKKTRGFASSFRQLHGDHQTFETILLA